MQYGWQMGGDRGDINGQKKQSLLKTSDKTLRKPIELKARMFFWQDK